MGKTSQAKGNVTEGWDQRWSLEMTLSPNRNFRGVIEQPLLTGCLDVTQDFFTLDLAIQQVDDSIGLGCNRWIVGD